MYHYVLIGALMLAALCAVPAVAGDWQPSDWQPKSGPLATRWAKDVTPDNVHPEYPRPQMVRRDWRNLNGVWDVVVHGQGEEKAAAQPILVPFPIESALSGVMKRTDRARYTRTFEVPAEWAGQRVLLHFEAVDWEATVSVNGKALGTHRGGYDPFSFDITDALNGSGPQTLQVDVFDPSDKGDQPRGKQVENPEGIWYTPSTGIWQTVWLEPVPAAHIAELVMTPDVPGGALRLAVDAAGDVAGLTVHAAAYDGSRKVGEATGAPGGEIRVPVPNAKLWSVGKPHLYRLKVSLRRGSSAVDAVDSYFGMRKVEVKSDGKVQRIFVNDEFIFQVGPLDQGFWPDGLYTAPTEAAMKYDIQATLGLGFNMIRKHVKVEPRRWYYWTDKLGVLVWQDMPSGNNSTDAGKAQFEAELKRMIEARRNHPSIILWVPFNEGWGQYDTERITDMVKALDPSRLVNNPSGWTDVGAGDIKDVHTYPDPVPAPPEARRASVIGEFGGYGLFLPGHMWSREFWGYRGLADGEELARRYEKAFRTVWGQKDDPGISAVVYTQTTDVETEANGLLTYDRAVLKAPKGRIIAANTGKLGPAPILVPVVPSAQEDAVVWRYTFENPGDGWEAKGFDDTAWKEGPAGFGAAGTPGAVVRTEWTTSDIWLRRAFTLPAGSTKDLVLWLHHDEDAQVYLNGVLVARPRGFATEYEDIALSAEARAALRPGENVLAIHCRNREGAQYIDAGLKRVKPQG